MQPRSGERIQPTAQAVGDFQEKVLAPKGRKKRGSTGDGESIALRNSYVELCTLSPRLRNNLPPQLCHTARISRHVMLSSLPALFAVSISASQASSKLFPLINSSIAASFT